ncbi:carbon-nitrogen hydrolase family protein [Neisseria wadsworthii]|uniref:Carbon-nitrogen family hydrolase n=1 Tax=Neisseria wadsworthii 9715 TaxID=1030841 RepID=G4CP16_9NEIS|nr:carbon-nitrogen hydrolase family protein [Neisseria wadsworthii]EGZ48530.1 carbon-nitrogen family hydrolase [Neisseria wadsworthii 9715]QMT34660.1 carbon-nitrogen hydrolase family protein [Neisseria wadsworthii]
MNNIKVAAIQMVSSTHPDENLETMKNLVRSAAKLQADWVLLPEYWPLMGKQDADKLTVAEPLGCGPFQQALSELAHECGVVLFGGTVPLKSRELDKVLNTMLVFDADGGRLSCYDKMHLFGYSGLGERYAEADTILAGQSVPSLRVDGWGVAQGVCYDIRFPEFFRAQLPFDVLMLPAAFTYTTGLAHWELLLRARAVENQCYVVAAAQGGFHENGRKTFGHTMIVDPWGEVLNVLGEGEGIVTAELDVARLKSVRARLPALSHKML